MNIKYKIEELFVGIALLVFIIIFTVSYILEYIHIQPFFNLLTPYSVEGISATKERFGRNQDGGYVVPRIILENTDAVMSYGIADDVSFEIDLIKKFNHDVYAFDCGIDSIPEKNDKLHFIKECIASDKFIYKNQKSSLKISSYNNQLKRLNLESKKILIKMDIEGAEYESFQNIPNNLMKNIQGIVIEVHSFWNHKVREKALEMLNILDKNFVIVHVHGNNWGNLSVFPGKKIPQVIEITYVNKSYVKSKKVSEENYPTILDKPNNVSEKDLILDYWK